ncbi:MAG: phosphopantetheine-binding protein [bacterium]
MTSRSAILQRTKELLVSGLRLEIEVDEIVNADAIFGEGLGLDSIDALEFIVLVEEEFEIIIPDEEVAKAAFASVDALADFIVAEQEATAAQASEG